MGSTLAFIIAGIAGVIAIVLAIVAAGARKKVSALKAELEAARSEPEAEAPPETAKKAKVPATPKPAANTSSGAQSQGLFATLSHELRTPLNGVLGMAQLIKQEHEDERIETLESCAFHMRTVLHALVNYSKIQSNWGDLPEYREWVNIHDLLEQTKREISARAKTRGLRINLKHADKKLRLRIDRDHLESIVEDAILGSLECVDPDAVRDGLADFNVEWEPADDGVKIIFENPLERPVANRGEKIANVSNMTTGKNTERIRMEFLYWAVSTSLLEHYHGAMMATSMDGGGVRTTLVLHAEKMDATPSGERPIGGLRLEKEGKERSSFVSLPFRFRMLVVEDDPVNRRLISEILSRLGQDFEHAKNGQEALELLTENSEFDAILMDIDMPVLNGVATTQALRMGEAGDKAMKTPIVAVTAFNTLSDESKFRKAGMNYFIAKPIGFEDLRTVLLDIRRKSGVEAS